MKINDKFKAKVKMFMLKSRINGLRFCGSVRRCRTEYSK